MLVSEFTIMPICEPVAFGEENIDYTTKHAINHINDINLKSAYHTDLSCNLSP